MGNEAETYSTSPPHAGVAPAEAGALPEPVKRPDLLQQLPFAVVAMRPRQWTKNGLVLLALVFARKLTDGPAIERALVAFFVFSLAASAVYIGNDLADRENDRRHPTKRKRPIASGKLDAPLAVGTAIACLGIAAALAWYLVTFLMPGLADPFAAWGGAPLLFCATIASYVGLNAAYSRWLKHLVLWDVFIIAAGFVLRALAGAFAVLVPISPWFYLTATFLALFLALGKRRAEMVQLHENAGSHRRILQEYTLQLLDQLLAVVVTSTLLTYSLYTFQGENASHALMITIPIVLFGVFRYLYLIYVKGDGGQPDELLWRDKQILGAVVLYVLTVLVLLYALPALRA